MKPIFALFGLASATLEEVNSALCAANISKYATCVEPAAAEPDAAAPQTGEEYCTAFPEAIGTEFSSESAAGGVVTISYRSACGVAGHFEVVRWRYTTSDNSKAVISASGGETFADGTAFTTAAADALNTVDAALPGAEQTQDLTLEEGRIALVEISTYTNDGPSSEPDASTDNVFTLVGYHSHIVRSAGTGSLVFDLWVDGDTNNTLIKGVLLPELDTCGQAFAAQSACTLAGLVFVRAAGGIGGGVDDEGTAIPFLADKYTTVERKNVDGNNVNIGIGAGFDNTFEEFILTVAPVEIQGLEGAQPIEATLEPGALDSTGAAFEPAVLACAAQLKTKQQFLSRKYGAGDCTVEECTTDIWAHLTAQANSGTGIFDVTVTADATDSADIADLYTDGTFNTTTHVNSNLFMSQVGKVSSALATATDPTEEKWWQSGKVNVLSANAAMLGAGGSLCPAQFELKVAMGTGETAGDNAGCIVEDAQGSASGSNFAISGLDESKTAADLADLEGQALLDAVTLSGSTLEYTFSGELTAGGAYATVAWGAKEIWTTNCSPTARKGTASVTGVVTWKAGLFDG